MRIAALTVVALGSTVAQAQPGMTPVAAPATSVGDRPWDVSLAAGWHGLRVKREDDMSGEGAVVVSGGLAAHYRVKRVFQVGLLLLGGSSGDPEIGAGGVLIDMRFRFRPEARCDVYAALAIGAMSVRRSTDPTDEEKKARGALRLGAGVERRWRRWGLHAELLFTAVAQNKELTAGLPDAQWQFARAGLRGFGLNLGGSFYF